MDVRGSDLRDQLQDALGTAYSIERELGGGGMARIFVAAERRFDRRVVVKVLVPDLAAGVSAERFEREVKLAAQLQQANIVPVFDAGEAAGLPFYTMPWVEGESLRVRLTTVGALPVPEASAILADVAKALAYAHAHGIVHRDIKPENILLSGGTAVVTDFGIAKAIAASRTLAPFETLTQVGTSLGTPAYMAPEQAMGDPATDHRADLYALGVTAYEMLAGQRPFSATSPHDLVRAHLTETPRSISELRPHVPVSLATIVMQCLEKDPADRPVSAEAVLRALDHVAPPVTRRRRLGAVAAGVILVGIVGAGAVMLRGRWSGGTSTIPLDPTLVRIATSTGGDSSLRSPAAFVTDNLLRSLAQIPAVRVLEDTAHHATGDTSTSAGAAGTVVSVSVAALGADSIRLQCRVIDGSTSRVIRVLPAVRVARGADDVALTLALDPLLATVAIITTPSLGAPALPLDLPRYAAVREMATAFAVFRAGDLASRQAMIQQVGRALAADTSYFQARLWYAAIRITLFASDYFAGGRGMIDSLKLVAPTWRDRFTPFETVLYDLVLALDRNDQGAILGAQRRIADLAPTSFFVATLPTVLLDLNHPREALRLLQQARPRYAPNHKLIIPDQDPRRWTMIADIEHYLHDYRAELRAAERASALAPGDISRLRTILRANAGLRDSAAIERTLALASTMQGHPNSYDFYGDLVMQVGEEIRAHGDSVFGVALVRRAIGWFETRGPEEVNRWVRFRWAIAHHDLDEEARAAEVLQPLLDNGSSSILYNGLSGRIAAARGDTAEARRIATQLAAMGSHLQGANTLERAFIASLLGNREAAVALLQQSFAEGQGFNLRWRLHWLSDTRPLRHYPPFEHLLEPQG